MVEDQGEIGAATPSDGLALQACCNHVYGQPWALAVNARTVTVVPRICCRHGELSVIYNGIVEPGHGPFVAFEAPAAAAGLALPANGAGLIR